MKHVIVIGTTDPSEGGKEIDPELGRFIESRIEKILLNIQGQICYTQSRYNVSSAISATHEIFNAPKWDPNDLPLQKCGNKNGCWLCNLPKGHAADHQHVNEHGNGGSVGWSKHHSSE